MTLKEWLELLKTFGGGVGDNPRVGELLTEECPICKAYGIKFDEDDDEWEDVPGTDFQVLTQPIARPNKPTGT